MKSFRRPFKYLAIICLFIGVMPYWQHVTLRGLPDGKTETKDVVTFGIPLSPLLLLERSHSEQVRDKGITASDSKGFRLEFVSWSMLALVLGAGLMVADRLRGGRRRSSPGD
jgi:hypothetical protein